MTTIIRLPIESSSDVDDPRPWVDLKLDSERLILTFANVGGRDLGHLVPDKALDAAKVEAYRDRVNMVLIIDLAEQTRWVSEDDQPYECIAHLAWYNAETDTLRLLQFVEAEEEA